MLPACLLSILMHCPAPRPAAPPARPVSAVIAMDYQSYVNVGDVEGNRPQDVVNPELGKLMLYMLCICVFGVSIIARGVCFFAAVRCPASTRVFGARTDTMLPARCPRPPSHQIFMLVPLRKQLILDYEASQRGRRMQEDAHTREGGEGQRWRRAGRTRRRRLNAPACPLPPAAALPQRHRHRPHDQQLLQVSAR